VLLFPRWLRSITDLLCPPIEDCGEYLLVSGGEGARRKDKHNDNFGPDGYHGEDEVRERVWSHAMAVIENALAAGSAKSGVNV